MSLNMFGQYQSQTTKQLQQIQSSKYPDTNKDFEANIRRLNSFVDYVAQYLTQMQKGVDQANEDAITRARDIASNLVVLLGGGELLYGINLGDLQYFLPALGALFGFDGETPFPINLINAVEHFFLGYVVPLNAFVNEIEDIILNWLTQFGIDEDAIHAIRDLLDAVSSIAGDVQDLFTNLAGILDIFGINTSGLGPLADIWHAVTQLLGGVGLKQLGQLIDPVFHTLAPWIEELATLLNEVDAIIKMFSGGTTNLQGILNFGSMFTSVIPDFTNITDPTQAWTAIFDQFLSLIGLGNLLGPIPVGSLTSANPNWITNGTFPAGSISEHSGGWSVDMSKTRTADGTGCAKITADGTLHSLNTGNGPLDRKAVGKGQALSPVIYVSHDGATVSGLGPPAILHLRRFNGDVELDPIELVTYSPNTPNVAFPGLPMAGQYLIPDGVTHTVVRVQVTENALSGDWRFDDAEGHTDVDVSIIPSFGNAITTLDQKSGAILDMLASVSSGIPVVGGGIAAAEQGLKNFNPLNILGPLGGVNIGADIQNFMNMFVGGQRGKPVTADVSMAEVYIAASQGFTNVAGQDVTQSTSVAKTIPVDASWANIIDVAGVGKGGNGISLGIFTSAGQPGKWAATRFLKGTHYDGTLTGVIITLNPDGSLTASIPGHSINFPAGANAGIGFGGGTKGIGPGTLTFNGGNYVGGETQNATGGNGLAPGGAGSGGSVFTPGGSGAAGMAWVRQLSGATAGDSSTGDTTPPSLPNWDVVATKDSLSFKGRDSVDA